MSNRLVIHCNSLEMVFVNYEDEIKFIKDDLSKKSLDNLQLTLEIHPSRDVHRVVHDLWSHFHKEYARHSLKNLIKRPCLSVFKKIG